MVLCVAALAVTVAGVIQLRSNEVYDSQVLACAEEPDLDRAIVAYMVESARNTSTTPLEPSHEVMAKMIANRAEKYGIDPDLLWEASRIKTVEDYEESRPEVRELLVASTPTWITAGRGTKFSFHTDSGSCHFDYSQIKTNPRLTESTS